ncbi:MAG: hypothetical protein ACFB50_13395 [Rubrobacteraceae bacterium]
MDARSNAPNVGKPGCAGKSSTRRRYDKELIRERTLELLTVRLGAGKDQGARMVWDCPACGKHEKYSVVKALGKGGCLVADCRLAGSSDVFVMLADLEGLDFQSDFLVLLQKSYELLGLEDEPVASSPKVSDGGEKNDPRNPAANGKGSPRTMPVSSAPGSKNAPSAQSLADGSAEGNDTRQDLDSLLELAAKVYERILEICPLESRDRTYLREERGIANETIRKARLGTMTPPRARKVKAQLEREFGREELLKVPGFSQDEKEGRLKFTLTGSYILIPYHDARGRVTTIEGRCVGEPPEGMGKYVSLRRAGNHLYVPPGYKPADLKAVTEGVMGSLVAADSGLPVGSIMGCERFKASPSPEMLDGAAGDPLLELKGADFKGRTFPYIPDPDYCENPNVLRAVPSAARWLAEPQNGKAAVCLLPEGTDLDEWLLQVAPDERGGRFDELMSTAHPPENVGSLAEASTSDVEADREEKNDGAIEHPIEGKGDGDGNGAAGLAGGDTGASGIADTSTAGPDKNGGAVLTAEDVMGVSSKGASTGGAAHSFAKGKRKAAAGKRKTNSKSKGKTDGTKAKAKSGQKAPQPELWEENSGDAGSGESRSRTGHPAVSAGARRSRDEVYRAMIELLPPKDDHLDALEKKGVMREAAAVGRFASLGVKSAGEVALKLAETFGAKRLVSVPGFELDGNDNVRLSMASGGAPDDSREYLLLPCFDAQGKLAGLEGLAYDVKSGELEVEETVPLKGAGSHLYVFAPYKPDQLEGICEGPLGALLAASDDVVIGATGGFRRYKAASGAGEGRQPVDAILPELEGVDFGERQIAYAPRSGPGLAEANARYHEVETAARWLVGRQNGSPAIVGFGDESADAGGGQDALTSLGEWILSLDAKDTELRLRELFPEVPATGDDPAEGDHTEGGEQAGTGDKPKGSPGPALPPTLVYGAVAVAAAVAAVLDLLILRLSEFAGYVSVGPEGDSLLYAGVLGPVRDLADSAPFQVLYSFHGALSLAAALALTVAIITKSGKSHRAKWRADRMRLEERWDLHLTPSRAPSKALLTTREVVYPVLLWPVAYLVSGWLIWGAEAGLSLAITLQMVPEFGADLTTLVENPTRASLYAATAVSAFALYQRRSIRAAHNRMLQGRIRH